MLRRYSWDALYERELQNHADDDEDEGTIWFDESNAEETVLQELDKLAAEGLLSKSSSTFLDLGTGNGHMLFALREPADDDDDDDEDSGAAGPWRGDMVGVDYSAPSIDLAHRIAAQRHERDDALAATPSLGELRLETWDLLVDTPGPWLPTTGTFDVVLDKGTFDAISLMSGDWHPCAIYRYKVLPLIKAGGFLVVTSCNWTRDELAELILPGALAPIGNGRDGRDGGWLELFREAKYPSFSFGGKSGQSVVTLIFRRG